MDVSWPQLVFSEQFFNRVNALAQRRFTDEFIADESVTYIINQLSEDDWAKCRKFTGKSKPETYLYSVSSNLIEEFARKKFGRVRPPEWLKREGELWVLLWRHICLERLHVNTVIDRVCTGETREPALIQRIVSIIKARLPWCGVKEVKTSLNQSISDDNESSPLDLLDNGQSLEDDIQKTCLTQALHIVASLISNEEEWTQPINHDVWEKARSAIQIDPEDQLMLRMHFNDGYSLSEIARRLGVANHVPGRQIKKVLTHIADVLKQNNLLWDSLLD